MAQSLEEQAKSYEEKIVIYKQELETVTRQLTQARTEKAIEAHKMLADYESRLPGLIEKVSSLNDEIVRLEKEITEKNKAYHQEEEDLKKKYASEEASLKAQYEDYKTSLQMFSDEISSRKAEVDHKESILNEAIEAREKKIFEGRKAIEEEKEIIIVLRNEVEQDRIACDEYCAKARSEIDQEKMALQKEAESIHESQKIIEITKKDMLEQKLACEAILNTKSKLETLATELSQKEETLKERQEQLSRDKVEYLANVKRLSRRAGELEQIEAKLKTREDNLRELEIKVGG